MFGDKNDFKRTLLKVLKGSFDDYKKISEETFIDDSNILLRYVSSYQLRVFVSSTFTDTHCERNAILDEIVPSLKSIGAPYGIEVVFIDMRYGVRDENTLDHMTWLACKTELNQCIKLSNGIFFLSLQGDKYGYQPIPKYVPQDLYDTKYSLLSLDDQSLLDQWYQLDANNIPIGRYVLKNLIDINDPKFWANQQKIRKLLKDIAFDRDHYCNDIIIDRSVTEYEARSALSNVFDSKRCLWISRVFENGVPDVRDFNDTFDNASDKLKLDNLKMIMYDTLDPVSNIIKTRISYDDYIANDVICKQYLSEFKTTVSNFFMNELNSIIDKKQRWLKDGFGVGIKGKDIDEMLHHFKIANDKCYDFTGRDELITLALDMIASDNSNHDSANVFSISLCCIGNSGTGKTALMSKLASMIRHRMSDDNIPVIIRFCGTSGDSMNGLNLVRSISKQIELLYGLQEQENIISDVYDDAVKYFHLLLSQYPAILFIDSLDQLKNDNQASSKITFLAGLKGSLHKNSRIIVSALPDERDKGYFYHCDTTLAIAKIPRVTVTSFDNNANDEAKLIITSLLQSKSRSLTDEQMNYVMNQVSIEPTALYIRLAVKVIENWTSFTDIQDLKLEGSVSRLINQLFDSLERDYGKDLVQSALGLITFSIGGLNINHLQDLLSLNEDVIKSTFQYSKPNKLQIPIHVIIRLFQALKGLIVERDDGKIYWYHRQLIETAIDRYKSDEKKYHLLMATYFGNLVDASLRDERLISEQPLVFGKHSPWFKKTNINKTVCIEDVAHMLKCSKLTMLVEAYKKLCNLDYICANVKIGEGYNLILYLRELERLLKQYPDTSELIQVFGSQGLAFDNVMIRIYHYFRWLNRDMSTVVKNTSQELIDTVTIKQPLVSEARMDMVLLLDKTYKLCGVSFQDIHSSDNDSSEIWLRRRSLGGPHSFDTCLMVIIGHSCEVLSVSFSSDGSKIVSGSIDNSIRIWDAITGTQILQLDNDSILNSVSFSPDGSKIVSGSGKSIRIWDAITGAQIDQLDGHSDNVLSVSFSRDGSKIVSGSEDKSTRIWDAITGTQIYQLHGHSGALWSVSFSPDGSKIVSGSDDKSIRMWDVVTGKQILQLDGHSVVLSVSFSPDGNKIVSGSCDKSVRIWDAITGTPIHQLDGHGEVVTSVSYSPDGSKIVSGSGAIRLDGDIRIWDVVTGTQIHQFSIDYGIVYSVSFSPDGCKIVSGSRDKSIRVWDITAVTQTHQLDGHNYGVSSLSFSPDSNKIVSGSHDKSIRVWDAMTGIQIGQLDGHSDRVRSVSFSPDGTKIVSGSDDQSIRIWDAITGNQILQLDGHSDDVTSVTFSPDGSKIVSGSEDYLIRIWDAITGIPIHQLDGHGDDVTSVSFNPDGSKVVSGSHDKSIRIWDPITGTQILQIDGQSGWVRTVSFSPDGSKIASGSTDESIRIWDAITGTQILQIDGQSGWISSISFSPDGSKIVSGSFNKSIRIWDVTVGNGTLIHKLDGHSDDVFAVSFSPDGSKIVSGSMDRSILVWDALIF